MSDHDPEIFDKTVRPDGTEFYRNKWKDHEHKPAQKQAIQNYRDGYDRIKWSKKE